MGQLREGWVEFKSRTWLWVIVGQFSLFHLLVFPPFMVLGALVARNDLGGAGAWAPVLSCQGVGALMGGLVVLHLRLARPILAGCLATLGFAMPLALLAAGAPLPLLATGALLSGGGRAFLGCSGTRRCSGPYPPPCCHGSARTTGSAR